MIDAINAGVTVPLGTDAAFTMFVDELTLWWPREYTWSGQVLDTIAIEPRPNGRCFERGPHGFECDWGRVVEVERGSSIAFLWQISPSRAPEPDPSKASLVRVRFADAGSDGTHVELTHDGFDNHGSDSTAYRDGMASAKGWPWILARYGHACASSNQSNRAPPR